MSLNSGSPRDTKGAVKGILSNREVDTGENFMGTGMEVDCLRPSDINVDTGVATGNECGLGSVPLVDHTRIQRHITHVPNIDRLELN